MSFGGREPRQRLALRLEPEARSALTIRRDPQRVILAHLGYTLYVRDRAFAIQHYARQARNMKLIDCETGIES